MDRGRDGALGGGDWAVSSWSLTVSVRVAAGGRGRGSSGLILRKPNIDR